MIYLDNAATTKVSDKVLKAMLPYLKESYGNAGSLHSLGRDSYNAVQRAREQVAKFINADPEQIIFTSGGTEANNMVFYRSNGYTDSHVAIVSAGEHESVLKAAGRYYRRLIVPLRENGTANLEILQKLLSENHADIVSVMYANNEIGSINPVGFFAETCHEYGVPFHTDAVQAAGFIPLNVDEIGCDFMSISSHKIHGPKGVGALYVKNPHDFIPMICGGNTQEFGKRGGTENVAGIVGFGKACELAGESLKGSREYISLLSKTFLESLSKELRRFGVPSFHINGLNKSSSSKTWNIRFDGISNETLLVMLDAHNICVSAGSACTSSDHKASHVLTAIGLSEEQANNSIRVSFSDTNTVEDVLRAAHTIAECVKMIRDFR